ncbi:putative major facilitator superfamily (MFS) transporter [Streptomyces bingchenggensis BCW-1]|uniref:Putative major facilitator superfamily (MFS) transporter n=2 Tax=Streptomyces TaxID=1883 RepID=D7BWF2_STRBB|nr:putative major facilitator superfamily (MFS) transporter [Streptomyces bingchenggensis BCW-1]
MAGMTQQTAGRAGSQTRDPWRYRWIVLGIATFTQAASGFFVGGIGALGVHLQRALDLSLAQLGLLVSAAQLVPLAGLLVAGELLDRYSERWVVGIGAGVVALALGAGSLAPGYAALLGALLVVGAGYSTVQPGGSKSVASWFDASQRGFAMGIRQAGLPLGAALASAVLPLVAEEFGWRATLLTGGFVALLGAVLFMGCYRPPPALPASQQGKKPSDPLAAQLRARLRMLREPSTVKIMLSGTSLISVQCGVGILTVLHLHQVSSVGAGQAALILVVSQGAGVAGRICLAAWSDRSRSGRYAIVLVCMVAVIAGLAVLMTPAGRTPVVASGVFVWLGFFGFGWYGPWVAYVTEAAPPGKTGFALGLSMSVNQIAIVTVPPTLGLLVDLTGSFTPAWALLSLLTAVALAVTANAERRTR